jgi:hypothetical protein
MLFQATSEEMIRAYSKVPRHVGLSDAYAYTVTHGIQTVWFRHSE